MKNNWRLFLFMLLCCLYQTNVLQAGQTFIPDNQKNTQNSERHQSFDENFKEKYSSADFKYHEKSKNALERWLDRQPKSKKNTTPFPFLSTIFYALIFLGLIYAAYIIIGLIMEKNGNWLFNKDTPFNGLQYGIEADDLKSTDFSSLINEYKALGEYRLAVRYQYLHTLQKLVQKGFVVYHKEKTNADYRYEIKKTILNEAFAYISYIYDHTWYGGFVMTETEYKKAELAFDDTNKLI
jgi:hypothetical protein